MCLKIDVYLCAVTFLRDKNSFNFTLIIVRYFSIKKLKRSESNYMKLPDSYRI